MANEPSIVFCPFSFFLSFFFLPCVSFDRMTRIRSASRRRQRAPANRCTNAVRNTWPSSVSSRCRGRSLLRPPSRRPPAITTTTASVANFSSWAERRHRQQRPSASNLTPPRSSAGCHRGATNEESSTGPVTVRLFSLFSFFFFFTFSLSTFIHYSFLPNPSESLDICIIIFVLFLACLSLIWPADDIYFFFSLFCCSCSCWFFFLSLLLHSLSGCLLLSSAGWKHVALSILHVLLGDAWDVSSVIGLA